MPAFPAFKTKPYYSELSNFLAASIDLATGELLDSAVRPVVVSELADNQTVVDAAAAAAPDAVAAELAATDFGPYVGPEVDAHIAADPGFTAAAETAVDNEVIGRDLLEGGAILEDDIAFAVVDEDGRRTWLEAGMDGKPTERAHELIGGSREADMTADGLAFAVVDENNARTWIEADAEGKPTTRALSLISAGLGDVGTVASQYIDATGASYPMSSGPDIVCWGDSMTAAQYGAYPAQVATLTGHTVRASGVGGEKSFEIAARQGAAPYLMMPDGGSIPASGSVTVALATPSGEDGWPLRQGDGIPDGDMHGTLAGVSGTLSLTQPSGPSNDHLADDYYTFTRDAAGDAVTVPYPMPFMTTYSVARRGDIAVIWAGHNNWQDPERIYADIAQMVQYLSPPDKRFLVLGMTSGSSSPSGTTAHTTKETINTELFNRYGRRFVDVHRFLVDYGLDMAGITPTAQDLADIANDITPDSLRADSIHPNADGCDVIGTLVAARLEELEWV